jgi:hypothetical protein
MMGMVGFGVGRKSFDLFLISMRGGGFLGEICLWGMKLECLMVVFGGCSVWIGRVGKKIGKLLIFT